jgi:hypothetical protein
LIFAILRNHQKFQKLTEFSLDNALIEIECLNQLKENRLTRQSTDESQSSTAAAVDASNTQDSIALSEKAKGKLPEGSLPRVASTSSIGPHRQASVSSTSSTASLLPGAKNGFIPTDDWVSSQEIYLLH